MNRPCLLLLAAMIGVPLTPLAGADWSALCARPDEWFRSDPGQRAIRHVLSWQSPEGGWPKNTDTTREAYAGDPPRLRGTFDNGATTGEMRFLARAAQATGDPRCQQAVLKGVDHILAAQYASGGWPQFHPPGPQYHRHITFNDGAMLRLLELLREVTNAPAFAFVDTARRSAAHQAFARGVECILRCQVRVDGELTAWCGQHDEVDFSPRPGRSFELASLCGAESARILRFLMSLDRPSPEIVRAIEAGVAWYAKVRITGVRVARQDGDRVVVADPDAPPLWARFYEIGSNRPIFAGRDGIKKHSLAEIEHERRNGYAWYGQWGEAVARDHAAWSKRHAER